VKSSETASLSEARQDNGVGPGRVRAPLSKPLCKSCGRVVSVRLDEFGSEVVFGDRDERVGYGDSWFVGVSAVAGAPASPVVAALQAGVLDYAERERRGQSRGDGAADGGQLVASRTDATSPFAMARSAPARAACGSVV
jgi:hypothetical protein